MQSELALTLLACAVAVSSISLLVQAIAAAKMYKTIKGLEEKVAPLIPQARDTLAQAQSAVSDATRDIHEVTENARELFDDLKKQVQYIDVAREEIGTHLKVQGERIELVLDDILSRTQDVVSVVHGSVLKPVREVSGVVAGVKAALSTLLMGRRPTVDRATQDDEMFI